mmetsp:Transcript_13143/g.21526  ORF Transcript_13143/g.21526 Transcript_13143/m.21526 type:complete len:202 (-) Transcript_13143:2183-2788(-)
MPPTVLLFSPIKIQCPFTSPHIALQQFECNLRSAVLAHLVTVVGRISWQQLLAPPQPCPPTLVLVCLHPKWSGSRGPTVRGSPNMRKPTPRGHWNLSPSFPLPTPRRLQPDNPSLSTRRRLASSSSSSPWCRQWLFGTAAPTGSHTFKNRKLRNFIGPSPARTNITWSGHRRGEFICYTAPACAGLFAYGQIRGGGGLWVK